MSGIKMTRMVSGLVIVPVLAGDVLLESPMQEAAEDFGPAPAIDAQANAGNARRPSHRT